MSETYGGALVKSISIENLLQQRDAILERVQGAIATLKEAQQISEVSGISDEKRYRNFAYMLQGNDHYRRTDLLDEGALATIRGRMDACAWNHLMHESGLRTLMDAKARKEWDDKINEVKVPELTAENVRATFANLYGSRQEIFERGVLNVFKGLSWDYKTNRPFAFGKRLVLRWLRNSVSGGSRYGWPSHGTCDKVDDLVRVLHVLDGKPEPDHRQGTYHQLYEEERTQQVIETPYLQIKSFKNGNGHLTFKRLDLVEKMNQILAKHYPAALPADRHEEAREFDAVKVA